MSSVSSPGDCKQTELIKGSFIQVSYQTGFWIKHNTKRRDDDKAATEFSARIITTF